MGESFQFIDIIFFAMIAAFLVLRLRSVLGRRDGHEGTPPETLDRTGLSEQNDNNVVPLRGPDEENSEINTDEDVNFEGAKGADPLGIGLNEIRSLDPSFSTQEFISGGRIAFELILGSYAAGNSDALKPLLSNDVFANFDQAIREREKAGETMEETLIGIKTADVVEAYMEESAAYITVKFISEQVHAIRDKDGEVVDGDPNVVTEVVDFWTFSHDMRSRDPNWILVATRSLD
ncbi:MAG: Tim44 domain-containing protein [Rhodospirillaceae bacterium]|jgi:predicted lipid-binding transport protein (Tim44 family)|nr:Tim44 domain-containing protein [Rhodospirillaceae bacterium]MBT7771167.1 Tim44 domain-containing protein [Rhodospirillales bacterium]MBT4701403.1 Tim44 domain-containing protein [Rhodospirillaceae bacterium]MBT5036231.1 Tim44 domain-containing protein [Rhodospirillaceae bacterium]MBT6221635.1 Tim44 domain-containing protein [Rhodospirillaceae bacterium]